MGHRVRVSTHSPFLHTRAMTTDISSIHQLHHQARDFQSWSFRDHPMGEKQTSSSGVQVAIHKRLIMSYPISRNGLLRFTNSSQQSWDWSGIDPPSRNCSQHRDQQPITEYQGIRSATMLRNHQTTWKTNLRHLLNYQTGSTKCMCVCVWEWAMAPIHDELNRKKRTTQWT